MIGQSLAQHRITATLIAALVVSLGAPASALEPSPVAARIDAALQANRQQLVEWRRHLHQNPELGNREVETAKFVAERLRSFGLEPRTGVARTGVVAVIEGGRPGPVVALRADMDALPVTEEVDLPFASKATATWEGKTVGCDARLRPRHPRGDAARRRAGAGVGAEGAARARSSSCSSPPRRACRSPSSRPGPS